MLSYAATDLVTKLRSRKNTSETLEMLEALKMSPKASRQFLILAHLYANTDTASLQWLRSVLVPPPLSLLQIAAGGAVATSLVAGRQFQ